MYTSTLKPTSSLVPPLGDKDTDIAPRFQSFDSNRDGLLSKPQLRNFLLEYFCPYDSPTQFLLDVVDDAVAKEGDSIDLNKAVHSIAFVKTKVATPIQPVQPFMTNPFAQPKPSPIFRTIPTFSQPVNPFTSTPTPSAPSTTQNPFQSSSQPQSSFAAAQSVFSNGQLSYPTYTPPPSSIQVGPSFQHGYPAAQYPPVQRPAAGSQALALSKTPTKSSGNPFSPSFPAPMVTASHQTPSPFAPQQMQMVPHKSSGASATHYVSDEERRAFAEFLNSNDKLCQDPDLSHVMPIDPNSDALFNVVSDGALFCKYLNVIQPGIIPSASIKVRPRNTFEKSENHVLAIEAAKQLGCSVVNIGPEDLIQGKPHLVMGLIWQMIKHDVLSKVSLREHPEIYQLTVDGTTSMKEISESAPEDVLLRWMNFHLKNAGHKPVSNFTNDMRDSTAYTLLMNQIAPQTCSLNALSETDSLKRAQLVMQNAEKLGCHKFLSAADIVNGNSRLNLAFIADLFNKHSALTMPSLEEFGRVKKQNATLSYILDDAEARLRQILSDQQLAYELQQQEICLYREQKLKEQRELAEQEAMLIAQQKQEEELLEQQKRLKNIALREQEAMAMEEQRKEQVRFDAQKRNQQGQYISKPDSGIKSFSNDSYKPSSNYSTSSAYATPSTYTTTTIPSTHTTTKVPPYSHPAYSPSTGFNAPVRAMTSGTATATTGARPSYAVASAPHVSSNTTLLTHRKLGVFQKVGKKIDRAVDRVKR